MMLHFGPCFVKWSNSHEKSQQARDIGQFHLSPILVYAPPMKPSNCLKYVTPTYLPNLENMRGSHIFHCCLQNRWWCRFWHVLAHHFVRKTCKAYNSWTRACFARWIYECYLPRRTLSIYQDRFTKSVPQTAPCIVYLRRQPLHTAQLITQSKHIVYFSQSVISVLGTYWIVQSRKICGTTAHQCMWSGVCLLWLG